MASEVGRLLELAEACEKASGPDRELDAQIYCALHPTHTAYFSSGDEWTLPDWMVREGGVNFSPPTFTASIDAALSLVPEGFDWIIEHVNGGLTIGARVGHNDPDQTSWGSTPALALAAAALRARASESAK